MKYLGIMIDEHLEFMEHIDYIYKNHARIQEQLERLEHI